MVFFLPFLAISQKMDFLPKHNLWTTQSLDPLASQGYGQVSAVWEDGIPADYVITGFAFGFQKSFFAWPFSDDKAFDIGIEGTAFTQFEWTNRVEGDFQRNIISTDFIIGLPLVLYLKPWTIRLRLYHLSAHMGDDYMIRNKINSFVFNNNNYEQIDLTTSYLLKNFRFYLGIGVVIRSTNTRAPMVFTGGMDYLLPFNKKKSAQLYAGFYLDSKQEFDFRPAMNVGVGVQLGKPDRRPIKILITYFNGPLPYSVFHGEPVQWLGAAIYINPF
jgi:hypothetical protein